MVDYAIVYPFGPSKEALENALLRFGEHIEEKEAGIDGADTPLVHPI